VEPNAVRRAYKHAEYLADRTVMMQRWADLYRLPIAWNARRAMLRAACMTDVGQ